MAFKLETYDRFIRQGWLRLSNGQIGQQLRTFIGCEIACNFGNEGAFGLGQISQHVRASLYRKYCSDVDFAVRLHL
ncbi:hypothetical protein R75483_07773 [Paraburkholderia domus]|nr:hypothetical protein R75483_07773 [Paraburkholderia domus]